MNRASILMSAVTLCIPAWAQDPIVFRSDVSLVRVDAQVVDRDNRAITHLQADDFVVREEGRPAPIRNFASENMPIDVLFLLDVSASMRPHVQRIADASGQALTVLGKDDHMAIMVFDRYTRVRLPFSGNHQEVQRAFDRLLRQEGFNGGTDITRAMLDAADYIRREGRQEARRAIVILTDDETEFNRDEAAVSRALARADAVMCALIAPDAMAGQRYPGSGGGQRRGTWGSGGGLGGPLGGIILGPGSGGPWGGNRYPRGGGGRGRPSATQSAGTAEIARDSGGDSMSVNDASALEETLMRLRQRYALFFNLPEGVAPGQERNIVVDLSPEARRRYPDAEVHYRRAYMSGNSDRDHGPTIVRHAPADPDYSAPATTVSRSTSSDDPAPTRRRRVAVNEDGSPISGTSDDSTPPPVQPAGRDASPAATSPPGGWPKTTPPRQQ